MRRLLVTSMGSLALLSVVSSASANMMVGDKLYFGDYASNQLSGPFTANAVPPSTFDSFQTFCVELEQRIYVNNGVKNAYQIDQLSTSNTSGRTMSSQTAWLYTAYLNGDLAGYVDDRAHNNALQYGIWKSMGYADDEIRSATGQNIRQAKIDLANYNWEATPSDWTGLGSIRIAQLTYLKDGTAAQDVLVVAPEPMTLLLLGVGAIFLGGWRRQQTA